MDGNWIKLNRQLLTSNIFSDAKTLQIFIWILLNANFKKRTLLNGLTLNVGQLCTSRERISNACNIPESTVYRVLKRLENCQSIVIKPNNKGSVIEVVNYKVFQHGEPSNEQQMNNKRTTNEQQTNREEERKERKELKKLNTSPQTDGLQTFNDSKSADSYSAEFIRFWDIWPPRRKTQKKRAFAAFKKAKRRIDLSTLMAAVEEYARSNKGRGEYCQQPATWLNGECWDDDKSSWNEGTSLPVAKKPESSRDRQISSAFRHHNVLVDKWRTMTEGSAEWDSTKKQIERLRDLMTELEGSKCAID